MKSIASKTLVLIAFSLIWGGLAYGQSSYRVYFRDKKGSEYNPYQYLHPKAIERRIIHGLDLYDSSDYPVSAHYLSALTPLADSIKGISRWMNMVIINTTEIKCQSIRKLPFVSRVEAICNINKKSIMAGYNAGEVFDTTLGDKKDALLYGQLERMHGSLLKANNLDGKGIRIAIIDAGFKGYDKNPAFEHIKERNGIVSTYDFVKDRKNTNSGMTHGSNVFSCIGGKIGNIQIGLATGAEYLLARTENVTEFFNEEENWLLAAEWADKNGADIINSSLGYTYQRYLPEEMDGKTAFVSRAAQIAVDKGMLVVSSAGNEGLGTWKRVAAPGDADGVLTVGGIDPYTGIHSSFSSFGPSWDRRLKPEVCAYGTAAVSSTLGLKIVDGTSFSSPLVAGFAACLKQRYPMLKNTEIKELICRSGDMWPYYDYAHGYGVPQPYFLFRDTIENKPTLSIIDDTESITLYPIQWDTAYTIDTNAYDSLLNMQPISPNDSTFITFKDTMVEVDSIALKGEFTENRMKDSTATICNTSLPGYLFYHIKNRKGYIDKYYVMDLEDEDNGSVSISKDIAEKPFSIEFYYKGYYKEIIVKE